MFRGLGFLWVLEGFRGFSALKGLLVLVFGGLI